MTPNLQTFAAATNDNGIAAFMTDSTGAVWINTSANSNVAPAFAGWKPLPGGGIVTGELAVTGTLLGGFAVFGISGIDGKLYYQYQQADGGWPSMWTEFSDFTCVAPPVTIQDADGLITVFAAGRDANDALTVYCRKESGAGRWQDDWTVIGVYPGTSVARLTATTTEIGECLCAMDDNHDAWSSVPANGGGWLPWYPVPGPVISPPSLIAMDLGNVSFPTLLAVHTADPSSYVLAQAAPQGRNPWVWSTIVDLSWAPTSAAPVPAFNSSCGSDGWAIFLRDTQDALYYVYAQPTLSGWSPLQSISPPFLFTWGAGPVAVPNPVEFSTGAGRGIVLFVVDQSGKMYFQYQTTAGDQTTWSEWSSAPAPWTGTGTGTETGDTSLAPERSGDGWLAGRRETLGALALLVVALAGAILAAVL